MASPPPRSPARTRLLAALLAVLVLALLEGSAALVWRLAVPEAIRDNVHSLTEIGRKPPLKVPDTFWHHDLNPRNPRYAGALNAHGTLGPDFALPKPPGQLRILCVGDSTTEGDGVPWQEAYPARLEELLRAPVAASPRFDSVRVINAGVGGHNSAFNLAYLALRLIHFQPDVVLLKSSYNDYLPYIVPGLGLDYRNAFPEPFTLQVAAAPYWHAARHSYLLRALGVLLFPDQVRNPFTDFSGHVTREELQRLPWESNEKRFFLYAENVRSMILLTKGRGMAPFVLDLPTSPDDAHFGHDHVFGTRFRGLVARLEAEERRVAREEGVPFIQTGPFVASDFWDHCHGTAAGNLKIAQRVAAALERWLAAPPRRPTSGVSAAPPRPRTSGMRSVAMAAPDAPHARDAKPGSAR